jgi:isopentenyl-diphosphate delta-isomerase
MTGRAEQVVLVADDGTPIGVAAKASVHTENTPLHLAFSCYLFDSAGRVLVTRRALDKKTWPGVWTNSFCGHPAPGESFPAALIRRADHEIGATIANLIEALPDFRYRAVDASGVVENEICPVFVATATSDIHANPDEVSEWVWVEPGDLVRAVAATPWAFSPWLTMQVPLLGRQLSAAAV